MLKPTDIAIVSGARTAMGRYCGKLRDFTAMELGAIASKCAIQGLYDSLRVCHRNVIRFDQPLHGFVRSDL